MRYAALQHAIGAALMKEQSLVVGGEAKQDRPATLTPTILPLVLGSRVANIVLNAQVQAAYACAVAARSRAQSAAACIERSWPDTPIRGLVIDIYRAQAQSADAMAHEVLEGARRRCGLAFAHCC